MYRASCMLNIPIRLAYEYKLLGNMLKDGYIQSHEEQEGRPRYPRYAVVAKIAGRKFVIVTIREGDEIASMHKTHMIKSDKFMLGGRDLPGINIL